MELFHKDRHAKHEMLPKLTRQLETDCSGENDEQYVFIKNSDQKLMLWFNRFCCH